MRMRARVPMTIGQKKLTPRWEKLVWTRYETDVHNAVIPVLAEGKRTEVMSPRYVGQWHRLRSCVENQVFPRVPDHRKAGSSQGLCNSQ
jgi:hypothetical protein